MLKLLIAIVGSFAIALGVLHVRQQKVNLQYEINQLHRQIDRRQASLWSQQLQISMFTAPNAIRQTVGQLELELEPLTPQHIQTIQLPAGGMDPDAE